MPQDSIISPMSNYGVNTQTKFTRLYNNPAFDYMGEMLPKNIKDLFKWCELVYNSAPVIANGIKKLVHYPVTDFTYKTDSEAIRKKTKELVEDKLNLRSHLLNLGIDYYIYGNAFRGLYFPFVRYLKCGVCGQSVNIRHAKYKLTRGKFILDCPNGHKQQAEVIDEDTADESKVKIVTWDPKHMDLTHNSITGETTYYYSLPQDIRSGILNANPTIINSLPKVFLDAFFKMKMVEFGTNFYHLKTPTLSGYATGWGISPLLPTLKPYLYTSILRKASEAIGLEHITPKKILFPQASTNDPSVASNLGRWREEITKSLKRWRVDPNYVMMAPYPTGSVDVGSRGRNLMPTQEIKEARNEMALALDVPPEFIFGGTSINNSTVSLRMLENQLGTFVSQITGFCNWTIDMINAKYEKDYCHVELTPFELVDDMVEKQMLMQGVGQTVSPKTMQESFGLDPEEERKKMREHQIKSEKDKRDVQKEISEMDQDIANQTAQEQQAEQEGTIPQYNQQKLLAKAQMLAQKLLAVPYEQRRSYLSQLQNEDYVMYALVSKQMESMDSAQEQQAQTAMKQQQ